MTTAADNSFAAPAPDTYRNFLDHNPDAADLLRKVPWVLNGYVQHHDALVRTLRNEAERLRDLASQKGRVTFSLLTPMWKTPPALLRELIISCQLQSWPWWELILADDGSPDQSHMAVAEAFAAQDPRIRVFRLPHNSGISLARNHCLEQARGDFVAILDHDDIIHPQVLGIFARHALAHPADNFIFSNEVKLSADGTKVRDFYSKPGFSYPTLLRTNYICHFTAVRLGLMRSLHDRGGYYRKECDGAEDHDVFLRLAGAPGFRAAHIPVFGYYWRMAETSAAVSLDVKPYVRQNALNMLQKHVGATRGPALRDVVASGERGGNEHYSFRFQADPSSRVLVVIPYRDKPELTLKCLESLEAQQTPFRIKVVLVDNRSADPATGDRIAAWAGAARKHEYVMSAHDAPFNYAAINNAAVQQHGGGRDFVLFLNNDVILESGDLIASMAAEMQRHASVAVTGVRLMHTQGGLQHGGIKIAKTPVGLGLLCARHVNGPGEFILDEHRVFAVTFACAMVRRQVFLDVGGFEETVFANGHSDVELCARINAAGHEVMYLGTLVALHRESGTRQHNDEDYELLELNQRHGAILSRAMLQSFGYNLNIGLPSSAVEKWIEVPLRYRVADQVNELGKKFLGPVHRWAKKRAR